MNSDNMKDETSSVDLVINLGPCNIVAIPKRVCVRKKKYSVGFFAVALDSASGCDGLLANNGFS